MCLRRSPGDRSLFVEGLRMGGHFLRGEVPDHVAQCVLFIGESKIHGTSFYSAFVIRESGLSGDPLSCV